MRVSETTWLEDKTSDGPAISDEAGQRRMVQDAATGSDGLLYRLRKYHDIKDVIRDTVDHPLNGKKQ